MTSESGCDSGGLRGEINVTPMIDVLLVLLIIFMVIVPVTPRGLEAALPQRSAHTSPVSPIVVRILSGRNGLVSYRINQDNVSFANLGSRLSAIFSARADRAMFVKADDDLDFSVVAQVVDIGRSAGAERVGLLTAKDPL